MSGEMGTGGEAMRTRLVVVEGERFNVGTCDIGQSEGQTWRQAIRHTFDLQRGQVIAQLWRPVGSKTWRRVILACGSDGATAERI